MGTAQYIDYLEVQDKSCIKTIIAEIQMSLQSIVLLSVLFSSMFVMSPIASRAWMLTFFNILTRPDMAGSIPGACRTFPNNQPRQCHLLSNSDLKSPSSHLTSSGHAFHMLYHLPKIPRPQLPAQPHLQNFII